MLKIEQGAELARFTTLGTGGPARAFARPESVEELEEALHFARDQGLEVATVGLGSNLLVADDGVDGLVLKLAGDLAQSEVVGELLIAGGGAANAVCLHRTRAAGLGGFEFACAIPGTTGGGVWMNAGAYGSDWAAILERALVVAADGSAWRTAEELGLSYRHSELRHGQVVARVEFRLTPKPADEIKVTIADLQAQRKAAQPTNKRTYGSVFKNPEHELSAGRMLEACGLKGHRIGGAQISPRHANFIENAGDARSADAVALMVEARRRAHVEYGVGLEHEVEFLGAVDLDALQREHRRPACQCIESSSEQDQGGADQKGAAGRNEPEQVHASAASNCPRQRQDLVGHLADYAAPGTGPTSSAQGVRWRRGTPPRAPARRRTRRVPAGDPRPSARQRRPNGRLRRSR